MNDDKDRVKEIQMDYGLRNLSDCPECNNRTMESSSDYDLEFDHYYESCCHFCGYRWRSSWSSPRHGRFYKEKEDKTLNE